MKLKIFNLLGLVIILFLTSCTPKEVAGVITINEQSVKILNASLANGAASQGEFTFDCDADWEIATEADWISINKTSGSAAEEISIGVSTKANSSDKDSRKATITIQSGSTVKTFTVTQMYSGFVENVMMYEGKVVNMMTPIILDSKARTITLTLYSVWDEPANPKDEEKIFHLIDGKDFLIPTGGTKRPNSYSYLYSIEVKENTTGKQRNGTLSSCTTFCTAIPILQN